MQHEWEACEICTEFQLGNRVRKKLLGRPRLRWEDIIGILKIQSGVCRLDSVVFRYGSLISSFEYGNETQDSIGAQRFCYRLGYGTVFVTGGSWCLCIQRRRRFPPKVMKFTDSSETSVTTWRHTVIPQVQFGSREESRSQLVRLSASEGLLFFVWPLMS